MGALQVEQLLFEDPENAEYAEIHNNLSEVRVVDSAGELRSDLVVSVCSM